jgi:acyl-CoA synthetase (NDP forming)
MTALRALLEPRSIAIVGATDASRQGRATYDNLRQQGYQGEIYLVNPRYTTLFDRPCYPSVLAVPGPIDVVVSAIGAGRSVGVLEESVQVGAKGAVVFADGFREAGPDGAQRQAQIQALATSAGLAICGPNCMGLVNTGRGLSLWMGTLNRPVPAGTIAAVAQSGTVGIALLNNQRGLRFSHLISSGNEAVTSSAAYLEHLVEDPGVAVLVNHLETLNEPHRYLRMLDRAADLGKPVVILKSGRSEQGGRVVAGHTGRVAGSDLVAAALLREHGAILVDSLDELVETTYLLAHAGRPRGYRIGFVSISGGYSGLTADLAAQAGLACPPTVERPGQAPLPNFVDAWGNGDMAHLPEVLDGFAQAPNIDAVGVVFHLSTDPLSGSPEFGRFMTRAVAETAARHPKPLIWLTPSAGSADAVAMQTLDEAGVPYLLGLPQGVAALAHATAHATRQAGPATVVGSDDGHHDAAHAGHPGPGHVLTENQSKAWLAARGIPLPKRALAHSEEDAAAATRRIGYPLVLKKQVQGVQHKTGKGYVRLGICDERAVRRTYRDLMALDEHDSGVVTTEGVLIEEQVAGGVELMVSVVAEAAFGPIVYLGYGGLTSELSERKAVRLAPLDLTRAASMLAEIGLVPVLRRAWGADAERVAGDLAGVLVRLSELGAANGQQAPSLIEINPLIVSLAGGRVVVADALVQLAGDPAGGGV